jgi:hypothetical protein
MAVLSPGRHERNEPGNGAAVVTDRRLDDIWCCICFGGRHAPVRGQRGCSGGIVPSRGRTSVAPVGFCCIIRRRMPAIARRRPSEQVGSVIRFHRVMIHAARSCDHRIAGMSRSSTSRITSSEGWSRTIASRSDIHLIRCEWPTITTTVQQGDTRAHVVRFDPVPLVRRRLSRRAHTTAGSSSEASGRRSWCHRRCAHAATHGASGQRGRGLRYRGTPATGRARPVPAVGHPGRRTRAGGSAATDTRIGHPSRSVTNGP